MFSGGKVRQQDWQFCIKVWPSFLAGMFSGSFSNFFLLQDVCWSCFLQVLRQVVIPILQPVILMITLWAGDAAWLMEYSWQVKSAMLSSPIYIVLAYNAMKCYEACCLIPQALHGRHSASNATKSSKSREVIGAMKIQKRGLTSQHSTNAIGWVAETIRTSWAIELPVRKAEK